MVKLVIYFLLYDIIMAIDECGRGLKVGSIYAKEGKKDKKNT